MPLHTGLPIRGDSFGRLPCVPLQVTISTLPDASWGNEEYKDVALMRLGDLAGGEENIQLKETKLGGLPAIQARYSSPSEGTTNLHVFTGDPQ